MGFKSTPATGANGRILIGNEAALGQPVKDALLDRKLCFTSESLAQTENTLESATICGCDGNARGRVKDARGSLDVAGDISVEMSPDEYGRLIRHAMGDYIQVPNAVGEAHGRLAGAIAATDNFAIFANYASFSPDGGAFSIVYRDDKGVLKTEDNAGAGFPYAGAASYLLTEASAANAALAVGDTITLAQGPFESTFLDVGAETGKFQIEIDEDYFVIDYTNLAVSGSEFTVEVVAISRGRLTPEGIKELTAYTGTLALPLGAPAYQPPCIFSSGASLLAGFQDPDYNGNVADEAKSGTWLYELWDEGLLNPTQIVYTHHFEIGELPQGLTANVLRDTVSFLYSGLKVNEWSTTFDNQAYITSSWSFIGIGEYSVISLARPAKVGDTTIYLSAEPIAFRTLNGTLTIGEEMKIEYGAVVNPQASASGLWEITGIPATGDHSIQSVHRIGENVDSSETAGDPIECDESPRLTSMTAVVAMDYKLIEVLNGSITLSNNIDGSKYMLGSRVRAALKEGRANVAGSITVEFDDGQHYRRFIDGDFFEVEFRVVCDDQQYNRRYGVEAPISLSYYMPQCKYTGTTPSIQDDSYLNTDMPFNAYDDSRTEQSTPALVVISTNYDPTNGL